jgi:hypothetical protein
MKILKAARAAGFLPSRFLSPAPPGAGPMSSTEAAPLTREDVCNGYQLILGREPENEAVITEHLSHKSLADFRLTLLRSSEFQGKYKGLFQELGDHPYVSWERQAVAFIHLQKTGGMTLHALLERCFPGDRVCPVRDSNLHLLPVAELGRFDLFSGHFDRASVDFIPRKRVQTVALFRNPQSRLISFYRFHRSHPPGGEFAGSTFVRLANQLSAEEFFEHPEVRGSPEVFNHYLLVFGLSFAQRKLGWPPTGNEIEAGALELAKQRVRELDGIGITEHYDKSVDLIFRSLGLPIPQSIKSVHVTDAFPGFDPRFSHVDPVSMTPRLAEALKRLTAFDDEIYREAVAEFERRRERGLLPQKL